MADMVKFTPPEAGGPSVRTSSYMFYSPAADGFIYALRDHAVELIRAGCEIVNEKAETEAEEPEPEAVPAEEPAQEAEHTEG